MGTCSSMRRKMMMSGGERDQLDYMSLTAIEQSTITRSGRNATSLEYSLDRINWLPFTSSDTISLDVGEVAYFRGNNSATATNTSTYMIFVMTGKLQGGGNIMSLLHGGNFEGKLSLPNMALLRLFYNCTALVSAPKLPATSLGSYAYQELFRGCTNLLTAPELPAPKLSYTHSYRGMFRSCSKLQIAPKLKASPIADHSYQEMFYDCSMLNYCMNLMVNNDKTYLLTSWMNGVQTTSGIFVKHIDATWTDVGTSGVPNNWTIIYYDPDEDKYYTSQDKSQECDDHGNPI